MDNTNFKNLEVNTNSMDLKFKLVGLLLAALAMTSTALAVVVVKRFVF